MRRSVAILGFGQLGVFLADKILHDPNLSDKLELKFVWNRSSSKLKSLPQQYQFASDNFLLDYEEYLKINEAPDIVVEASHTNVVREFGPYILKNSDLLITTVSALANDNTLSTLIDTEGRHKVYIPSGAAWGIHDIMKLEQSGNLKHIKLSMSFGADALRLNSPLKEKLEEYLNDTDNKNPLLLFKGNVRELAPLAPNNVNTMCSIALAAPTIGFDGIIGNLLAHKDHHAHIIEIECYGKNGFYTKTTRVNPAQKQAVTGKQTFHSFLSSLLLARGGHDKLNFC